MVNKRYNIHTALIKLNGVRVKLQDELEELKAMRGKVHENQISKLETRIHAVW